MFSVAYEGKKDTSKKLWVISIVDERRTAGLGAQEICILYT
jgi:hypothetical protein